MSEGEEKTEEPTQYRLQEARKKGRVIKSTDVTVLLSSAFAFFLLALMVSHYAVKTAQFLTHMLVLDGSLRNVETALGEGLDLWFWVSLPVLFAAFLGAISGNLAQFGFLFTTHPLTPDIKKLNPIAGLQRLFSKDRAVELIKQLLKFAVVFVVISFTMIGYGRNLILLFRLELGAAIALAYEILRTVIVRVLLCFCAIAIIDYMWQRHSFLKSLRMSKYEVKKEYKSQDGDPHLKSERRRLHQEVLESEVLDIKDASVVITNPAHLAAAIKYDESKDSTPKLLTKGVGKEARDIIHEAQKARVPIVRNVPLARDLQWLEKDEEIPEALFDSVAEVLTFINELNRREGV